MPDERASPLLDLLRRFRLSPEERGAFVRADTEAAHTKVRLLTAAAVYFNTLAVDDFGGRLGPSRGLGLVEQAVAAAFQTYAGVDPHPTPFDKAAMLLRGITQGHPFSDGNKRTGFLIAAHYLDLIGHPYPPELDGDAVVTLCLRVSAGDLRDVAEIARQIERLWTAGDAMAMSNNAVG